jgi:hypothetical protein
MARPAACLSLDLDNYWSYLKTHGNPAWETYPSYLAVVVPRALAFLQERGLRVTVFIVGQDALQVEHREVLSSIAAAGHEIGNHSHHHEPWLHQYQADQVDQEIRAAHEAIREATGVAPRGFRGPGFSVSEATLETLIRLGYLYDGSTLPTFIGPLARAYYFRASKLTAEERRRREALFGGWRDVLRPITPYRWETGPGGLVEVPVTTVPLLRLPFHFSYLLYIAERSEGLAVLYLRTALGLCRLAGVAPSLLLHPLDFLGPDEAPGLEFFPGMGTGTEAKLRRLGRFVEMVTSRFAPGPMGEYVASLGSRLRTRRPDLRS